MNQTELYTDRLVLRQFEQTDALDVERMAGDKNVAVMTLNIPHPYLPGMGSEWISTHERGWKEKTRISYAITLAKSGQLIGAMGLVSASKQEAELGYWIGREYWGSGYCTEAAEKLLEFGCVELGFKRIVARHLAINPASGRVMQKCGMDMRRTSEGIDRNGNKANFVHYEFTRT